MIDADIVFYDGSFAFFTGTSGCSGGYYIEDVADPRVRPRARNLAFGRRRSDDGVGHRCLQHGKAQPGVGRRRGYRSPLPRWRRRSAAAAAATASSAPKTSVPVAPTGPSPADGSTGIQVSSIGWAAAVGATSYDVYVGTGANPPLYAANVAGTSVSLSRLANSTTYYWRVVAKNAVGASSGSVWRFTTRAKPGKGR